MLQGEIKQTDLRLNWSYITGGSFRMPIYGGLGSGKPNTLIILIKHKDADYDTFDKNLLTCQGSKWSKI